ncbi:MAG: hypothetical protein ABDH28_03650, partial [Brevinematia bacterium]
KDEGVALSDLEEMENMISISNEELDDILSGATIVEEEERRGVDIESVGVVSEGKEGVVSEERTFEGRVEVSEIEEYPQTLELETETLGIGKSVEVREEVISSPDLRKESEVVVMSAEEYNRMVEESQGVTIVEKPIEEVFPEIAKEEEVKESVAPEELGITGEVQESKISEEFELGEFEEMSEEAIISEKLGLEEESLLEGQVEGIEIGSPEEELVGEELSMGEISARALEELEVKEVSRPQEKVEVIDDISLELEETPQKEFSIMPDEVGLEEIETETKSGGKLDEEILGIGFEEQEVAKEVTPSEEIVTEASFEEISADNIVIGEISVNCY